MDALTFLTSMWPAEGDGYYCIAIPFTPRGSDKKIYSHKVFGTIAEAAKFCEKRKDKDDIFYCVHTLKHERVWNAKKKDMRTGGLGAWEYRTQANMEACKNLFFDLDVGEVDETGVPKYATQREALEGLKNFCETTQLPKPMIVSSGGGLHVYWRMNAAIPTDEWKIIAAKLKKVAQFHKLKFDPSRTTDSASVLRVAGTFNQKKDQPRPVKVYAQSAEMHEDDFSKLLDDALIRANLPAVTVPANLPALASDFVNTQKFFDGPPVSIKSLLGACPQIFRVAKLGGNVSEPEWYAALASVRLVEDGDKFIHKISEKHPNYSHAETEAKAAQLEKGGIGPTGCDKWHDLRPEVCEACPLWGQVKSPMAAARRKPAAKPAPAPVAPPSFVTTPVADLIPAEPFGYTRNEHGVFMTKKTPKGDEVSMLLYPNDLYPLRRIVNRKIGIEEQLWRVELPRAQQPHDFLLPADALYDRKKFVSAIANNGIYTSNELVGDLQNYMIAYIAKLQQSADAETQHNHLGWTDDHQAFILPDKIIHTNGEIKRVSLSQGASRSSRFVSKNGNIQDQVKLLDFYNHNAYAAHQFFILCGLAAPLFYMTGHHGVIVNASGKPGASKSSALYTAGAFWGHAVNYAINGTNRGATANARDGRMFTLANLPICVDEITNMDPKDASDLAMSVTQPGGRIRNTTEGIERVGQDSEKATMMLTTANSSLHTMLSTKNVAGTAGSMRVFEITFLAGAVHTKPEADDYLHDLKLHYGHIGEAFMLSIIKHLPVIHDRVRKVMKEIDIAAKITAGERFWSATIASALVAGEIGNRLGLIPFDMSVIRRWVLERQIPFMRGVIREEYTSPIVLLTDYLSLINENILVVQSMQANNNIALAAKMPRGALLARYEQDTGIMYILKSGFKSYCTRTGANERMVLEDLGQPKLNNTGREIRLVVQKSMRKVLGAGFAELDKGQALVFALDMNHPLIAGKVPLGNPAQVPAAKTGKP